MVEVICEMEVGQKCQITDFFWMTHPAVLLTVVYSQQQGIKTVAIDFLPPSLTLGQNTKYPKYC